jgi:two-component system response regulator
MNTSGSLDRSAELLVVEDNQDDARLIKLMFGGLRVNHRLHFAKDGDDALAFLLREGEYTNAPRPDLVLLDLNMPGKDGRTVLREVKEHEDLRQIPVIILTTSDAGTDRSLTYHLHANAFLTKPVDLDDWEDLVRTTVHFWLDLVQLPVAS